MCKEEILYSEGGVALEQIAWNNCGCPVSGGSQSQVGQVITLEELKELGKKIWYFVIKQKKEKDYFQTLDHV